MSLTKNCKNCKKKKPISEFPKQKSRGKEYINNICKDCAKQQQKEYRENNKEAKKKRDKEYYESVKDTLEFVQKTKEYRDSRKEEKAEYDKNYRTTHKEEYQEYCQENKEKIAVIRHDYYIEHKEERKEYNKQWYADNKQKKHKINAKYVIKRLKKDIAFKLRCSVSKSIRNILKKNGSSKSGNSILNFLPYSIQELKEHLEKQFEPWMAWDNWGSYRKHTWSDNDSTTWTWQIDHIIPQSSLVYISMEDDNFKKCWSLENLRPLLAKQNLLDGDRK